MKTYNNNKFPIFEAEQVLSHTGLNTIIGFFEEQMRLSRTKLIGVGLLDGMEISFNNNSVTISCGTAITSLGFLIDFPETTFSYYFENRLSEDFIEANYIQEPFLAPVLKYSSKYVNLKNCLTLLTSESDNPVKSQIPNNFFDDKLIVILLEVKLINQKGCVAGDCDDKGKRIELETHVIAVEKENWELDLFKNYTPIITSFKKMNVPRFNFDNKDIVDANSIFNAFGYFLKSSYVSRLSEKVKSLYLALKEELSDEVKSYDFENVMNIINDVVKKTTFKYHYQYIYDWLLDITDCYNEIIEEPYIHETVSCRSPIEYFPFHIVLGGVNSKSADYRTKFYPISKTNDLQDLHKLDRLFLRLKFILQHFKIPKGEIKITPSRLGNTKLSDKSIPFYYDNISENKIRWGMKSKGYSYDEPLSYHDEIKANNNPLLYNLDDYNFFRLEGHIGQPYNQVVDEINILKEGYRLPFHISAVNAARFKDKTVSITKFQGRWNDIETDYDLAKIRFVNICNFVMKWINDNKGKFEENEIRLTDTNINHLQELLDGTIELLTEDLMEFLGNYENFAKVFKEMNNVFLMHKMCIQNLMKRSSTIADELYSRIDDINELFLENPFLVLNEEAIRRWSFLFEKMSLEHFYQHHSSIEHRGGVVKGGTFVLVYLDNKIFEQDDTPASTEHQVKTLKSELLINNAKSYKDTLRTNSDLSESEIKRLDVLSEVVNITDPINQRKNLEVEKENYKTQFKVNIDKEFVLNLEKEFAQSKLFAGVQFSDATRDFIRERVIDSLRETDEKVESLLEYQNLIIADFYLPYVCCSDATPLQIQLEREKKVLISINQTEFCKRDDSSYEIHVDGSPDGIFLGETSRAITKSDQVWSFNPALLSDKLFGELTIQYSVDGVLSNILEIRVEQPRELQWKVSLISSESNKYLFSTDEDVESEYIFIFDDGTPDVRIKEKEIEHQFEYSKNNSSYSVKIKEMNSICNNYQEIMIVTGDFDSIDFDNNDFSTN